MINTAILSLSGDSSILIGVRRYIASVGWCLMVAQWIPSLSNSNSGRCHLASFPVTSVMVKYHWSESRIVQIKSRDPSRYSFIGRTSSTTCKKFLCVEWNSLSDLFNDLGKYHKGFAVPWGSPCKRCKELPCYTPRCRAYSFCSVFLGSVLKVTEFDSVASPAQQIQSRSIVQSEKADHFPLCPSTVPLGTQNSVHTNDIRCEDLEIVEFTPVIRCCTPEIAPVSFVDIPNLAGCVTRLRNSIQLPRL